MDGSNTFLTTPLSSFFTYVQMLLLQTKRNDVRWSHFSESRSNGYVTKNFRSCPMLSCLFLPFLTQEKSFLFSKSYFRDIGYDIDLFVSADRNFREGHLNSRDFCNQRGLGRPQSIILYHFSL